MIQIRLISGIVLFAFMAMASFAAVTENTYTFDAPSTEGFASIERPDTYDDEPVAANSDTFYPAAFPPPSPAYALSVRDTANNSFGLCSAVGGTIFDRADALFTSATLQAEIYIVSSAAANEHNFALLAINNGTGSSNEAYYRLGYRNSEVYLQKFNGAFTTLGTPDTAIDEAEMVIPGYNTFTIQFVGPNTINLSVNGVATSFSPINDTDAAIDEEIQVGLLGFNFVTQEPIIADNVYEKIVIADPPSSVDEWIRY